MIYKAEKQPVSERRRSDSAVIVEERLLHLQAPSFDCALPYGHRSAQELSYG